MWEFSPGGYSTLGWVRMCGPKFQPPPYNKTREDANLQPVTKPFASWRTLFKTNQYFLPYKLGCISTFWQPIGKLKGKIQRKLCILQKCDLYLNQFSNKKGAIGKPERPKKHPIWAAHPRTHLSTKYPPPPGNLGVNKQFTNVKGYIVLGCLILHTCFEIKCNPSKKLKFYSLQNVHLFTISGNKSLRLCDVTYFHEFCTIMGR